MFHSSLWKCFLFAIHFVHTKNNLKVTWHGQSEIPNWLFGKHELWFLFLFFNTNIEQVSGTTLIIQADWKVSKHQLRKKHQKTPQQNKNTQKTQQTETPHTLIRTNWE